MALAGADAIAALVCWPLALARLVWLVFMPWEDAPDWVTPEKDEAEEEVKKGDAFWMWNR